MSQVDIIEGHSHFCDRNHCEEFPRAAAAPPLSDSVALLVVDVQPESWSGCPQVRTDFSDFRTKLRKTIALARRRKAKIAWIRAEYSYECSPWLVRMYGKEPPYHRLSSSASWRDGVPRHSASSSSSRAARKWEAFAIPQPGDIVVTKHKSLSGTHHHTGLLSFFATTPTEHRCHIGVRDLYLGVRPAHGLRGLRGGIPDLAGRRRLRRPGKVPPRGRIGLVRKLHVRSPGEQGPRDRSSKRRPRFDRCGVVLDDRGRKDFHADDFSYLASVLE